MKPVLQLKLSQQLNMTPQLQQAIRLLQLSSLELETEIQALVDSNPLLENLDDVDEKSTLSRFDEVILEAPPAQNSEEPAAEIWEQFALAQQENSDSVVDSHWDESAFERRAHQSNSDAELPESDWQGTAKQSLRDHLNWQKELAPLSPQQHAIATAIIDVINEDGYLTTPLKILCEDFSAQAVEFADMEAVLRIIQGFEPLGVGARDLKECLSLQLKQVSSSSPGFASLQLLISDHLDLLAKKQYTRLKSRLKLSELELQTTVRLLQSLNPRPGTAFYTTQSEYIVPDVIVVKLEEGYQVELNQDFMPRVRINPTYAALTRRADASRDNVYLKEKLLEARWLMKSLKNRQETLLQVSTCIVEQQQGFFEHGPEAMKPMILQDIARATQLHESTISRITTQKYMLTPKGVFELKYFFSSQLSTDTGAEFSSTAIRALIKKLIHNETRQKPYSDQKIVTLLAAQGITIARRTVAKYREAMLIPPSNERKQCL